MLTRRCSTAFLLETINRGSEFIEILKTFYPKAETFQEEDFDWLFDCPQTEQFLEWFCNAIGEENVLNSTELEIYEKLVTSEKPVLEGEALEQVLKTCNRSFQLKAAIQENEFPSLEALEQEMEMLKRHRAHGIKRRYKLQIWEASLKQDLCQAAEKKEKASREMNKVYLQLQLENFRSNYVLNQACEMGKKLVKWHKDPGNKHQKASMAVADVSHYLELEEKLTKPLLEFFLKDGLEVVNIKKTDKMVVTGKMQGDVLKKLNTETIARLAQTVLLENKGIICGKDANDGKVTADVLKGQVVPEGQHPSKSTSEFLQKAWQKELDQSEEENLRSKAPVSQGALQTQTNVASARPPEDDKLCSFQKELDRLQLAYICHQIGVVLTSAEIQGISSALQWAGTALKAVKENKVEEEKGNLCLLIGPFQEQLHIFQSEIRQANEQKLLPLIQGTALLLCLPVISGELDLESERLGHLESMLEKGANLILSQLSHLELLKILVMQEQKSMQEMETEVEQMVTFLRKLQAKLQEWLSYSEDSKATIKQCPRTLIDPNDFTMLRLWEMLDKNSQEKQIFHVYQTLASWSSRLCQELRLLQEQLAMSCFQLSKMESDNEALYYIMYGDTNQLMLHAQEISEPLEKLGSTQAKLYQMLMDVIKDVKGKYKSLQNHFLQTERNLYIYFFNDPDQLKGLIHEIEKQTLAFSEGKL